MAGQKNQGDEDDDEYGQQHFEYDSEEDLNPYGIEDEEVNDIIVNEEQSPNDLLKQRELLYTSEHGQSSGFSDDFQRVAPRQKKQHDSDDVDQFQDM